MCILSKLLAAISVQFHAYFLYVYMLILYSSLANAVVNVDFYILH